MSKWSRLQSIFCWPHTVHTFLLHLKGTLYFLHSHFQPCFFLFYAAPLVHLIVFFSFFSQLGFSDGWFWFVCICIMNVICMLRGRPYHENGCVSCLCVWCVCSCMATCVFVSVRHILSTCKCFLHKQTITGCCVSRPHCINTLFFLSSMWMCATLCLSMYRRIPFLCVKHVGQQSDDHASFCLSASLPSVLVTIQQCTD